uniref:NADH-ubiquinone oxidoreductase chain 6 n=1 Tax=Dascillus cervinus TaxID=285223 RepID=H6W8I8_9COLE|nr:NADH dehydrogenase subunit 6 [Dascillus cervinus]
MLMLITNLSLITSLIFILMNHPMSMGLALLTQTILITLLSGILHYDFWFSYIIFLTMISGMLILFIYMTSVASNEMFKFSNKTTLLIGIFLIMLNLYTLATDQFFSNYLSMNNDLSLMESKAFMILSLNKYLNLPNSSIFYLMIIYLLVTLIAIVKITNVNYGPLRSKF